MRLIRRIFFGIFIYLVFASAAAAAGEMRIVSLSPAVTELVFQLGQGRYLVGRSEVCNYPAEVRDLPIAGRYADPDIEKVLGLRPTLVVSNDLRSPGLERVLRAQGIRLIVKQCRTVEEYREWVVLLGRVLDCPTQAKAELERFDREIAELRKLKPLSASLLWVVSDSPLLTGGRSSLLSEVSQLAGMRNAGDVSGLAYYRISRETLINDPPDVIIWANSGASPGADDYFWGGFEAVRKRRILRYLHEDTVMRPGPRLPEGIRKLRREVEAFGCGVPVADGSKIGKTEAAGKGIPAVVKQTAGGEDAKGATEAAGKETPAVVKQTTGREDAVGADDHERKATVVFRLYAAVVGALLFAVLLAWMTGFWNMILFMASLGAALLIGVLCGSRFLPPSEWFVDGEWNPIFVLRLMRQLTALTVGASLAVAGAVFQTVLRNPLAEPFTLGISGGSGVGAALAIILHLNAISFLAMPLCALFGALCALGLVLFGAGWRRDGGESILLGGVIVGTICGSVLMYLLSVADNDQLAGVTWWMLGDLQAAEPRLLLSCALCLAASLVLLRAFSGELNALAFGDAASWNFGGDPVAVRRILIVVASLLAAGTVALAGMIGFVGLMIPHAVRRFRGCDHRKLLPILAVTGGAFLMLCDLMSRVVCASRELPVGVITSAVGGTLFLYLLKRRRRV